MALSVVSGLCAFSRKNDKNDIRRGNKSNSSVSKCFHANDLQLRGYFTRAARWLVQSHVEGELFPLNLMILLTIVHKIFAADNNSWHTPLTFGFIFTIRR